MTSANSPIWFPKQFHSPVSRNQHRIPPHLWYRLRPWCGKANCYGNHKPAVLPTMRPHTDKKRNHNRRHTTLALPELQRIHNQPPRPHQRCTPLQNLSRLDPFRGPRRPRRSTTQGDQTHLNQMVSTAVVYHRAQHDRPISRLRPSLYRRHLLPQEMPARCMYRHTRHCLALVFAGKLIGVPQTPRQDRPTANHHH